MTVEVRRTDDGTWLWRVTVDGSVIGQGPYRYNTKWGAVREARRWARHRRGATEWQPV